MNNSLPIACPAFSTTPNDPDKRLRLIATGMAGGVAALSTAIPFASSFEPSERAKAAGRPVEVDIAGIPPGGTRIVEWRGKPVWIGAGRVFKDKPAPTNLEIPPYRFASDTRILIGDDAKA